MNKNICELRYGCTAISFFSLEKNRIDFYILTEDIDVDISCKFVLIRVEIQIVL